MTRSWTAGVLLDGQEPGEAHPAQRVLQENTRVQFRSNACENCAAGTYSSTPSGITLDVCLNCPLNSDAAEASDSPAHCICNARFSGAWRVVYTVCYCEIYSSTISSTQCTRHP